MSRGKRNIRIILAHGYKPGGENNFLKQEKIKSVTKQGMSAYNVRMQERLTCSKDVLYAARQEGKSKCRLGDWRWNVLLRKCVYGRSGPT